MQFGLTFQCLLYSIASANLILYPVFPFKTNLSDAYMRIWPRIEDLPAGYLPHLSALTNSTRPMQNLHRT
eukprot:8367343-Ditylum_brightwellii.AAC.1